MASRRPVYYYYTIEFRSPNGCSQGILKDMLRHDGQFLVDWELRPDRYGFEPAVFTKVVVAAPFGVGRAPNMERWASFAVGANIVAEEEMY